MSCCSECVHMNINDENSYGEFYCGKKGRYYPGSYSPCNDGESRENSGGCYVTTAVCNSLNKPDDCYELNSFRRFRDQWLKFQPDGEKLISDYYEIAPAIVDKINTSGNAQEIYASIWKTYLERCLHLIETGDNEGYKRFYIEMVKSLESSYLK